ncbi:MAG: substrate-binding domain-containing protein, partial [Clostridiales bacterium]
IVIAGSSSVSPVMEKLVESYKAINKDAEIEIQTSDSTAGVTGCIEGTCDIGMASRDLKDTEKESLKATAIALDGIAVIVNQENPISNMTKDQVKSIFVGETTTWDAVK